MGETIIYTENELISLLKNRDSQAFGYLYDNYSAALNGIIMQIVDDTELSNDIVQEVFINVWRKMDSYDPSKGRLFTWLLNIARNAAIDTVRSKGYQNSRKNRQLSETVDGNRKSSQPDMDNIGLKKILEKLKREQRELIVLSYFKGYTHEEIAAMKSIPLGTVKTRIRTALIQLRELMK